MVLNKAKYFKKDANKTYIRNLLKDYNKDYSVQSVDKFERKYLEMLNDFDLEKSIEGKIYSQLWCNKKLKDVKRNYDINMKYFSSLSKEEFNSALNAGLKKLKNFHEIYDLNKFWYKPGYYILVLGDYKQIYIGTTDNIANRIKQHWIKKKPFDRLIFPSRAITTSKLSIDAFGALDTSRIFIYQTKKTYEYEDKFILAFPLKFVLNRVDGGINPSMVLHSENLE